jgi:hypothetical protein
VCCLICVLQSCFGFVLSIVLFFLCGIVVFCFLFPVGFFVVCLLLVSGCLVLYSLYEEWFRLVCFFDVWLHVCFMDSCHLYPDTCFLLSLHISYVRSVTMFFV